MHRLPSLSVLGALLFILAFAAAAHGSVTFYDGENWIDSQTGVAAFDGIIYGTPIDLSNYQEAGLSITVNDNSFGGGYFYANAGAREPYVVTRLDGQDFQVLEMAVRTGWGSGTRSWWLQAYLDDTLVGEWDHDLSSSVWSHIGLRGQFDELRVGAFSDAATRDLHDWGQLNAAMLDNVTFGAPEIPAPGAVALGAIGLGLLAWLKRRCT